MFNEDSPDGIDVCLTCFNGSCTDQAQGHTKLHHEKTRHYLYLNIKRKRLPSDSSRPEKLTKLSIQQVEERYEFQTQIFCYGCKKNLESTLFNVFLDELVCGNDKIRSGSHVSEKTIGNQSLGRRDVATLLSCERIITARLSTH
jgi:ubiquitin carboxyl-terminal hydrolase 5/13